jgi:serine/threonine protein kinase
MKHCPECKAEFDAAASRCPRDGRELEARADPKGGPATTLAGLLRTGAPLGIPRAVAIVSSLCRALADLDERGEARGLLDPRAVVLTRARAGGEVVERVSLANPGAEEQPDVLERVAPYLAPEAARQQASDALSLVYSVGAVAYELLAGRPVFTAASPAAIAVEQILEEPARLRDLRPEIPGILGDVVHRALAKERTARQASLRDLQEELEGANLQPARSIVPGASEGMVGGPVMASAPAAPAAPPPAAPAPYVAAPAAAGRAPEPSEPPRRKKSSAPAAPRTGWLGISALVAAVVLVGLCLVVAVVVLTPAASGAPGPAGGGATALLLVLLGLVAIGVAALAVAIGVRRRARRLRARENAPAVQAPAETIPVSRGVREKVSSPAPPVAAPTTPEAVFRDVPTAELRNGMERARQCLTCKTLYPSSAAFCPSDGTPLVDTSGSTPARVETPPAKQCPYCGIVYTAGEAWCRVDGASLVAVPGGAARPPEPEVSPFLIGQYQCFARVGAGGMGMVYKARHVLLDRVSAVKVLLPQAALQPDAVQLFRREARLASSINHPNSVIIYDYGETGPSLFYLAMEYINGRTLADALRSGPLGLERTLCITRQMSEVLDVAHSLGIVHRDLKPQNVMIYDGAGGREAVKVLDFGIARSVRMADEYRTEAEVIRGTPAYMAPEQASGDELDERADVFSLGLIVYEMLSGRPAFPITDVPARRAVIERATLSSPPPPLASVRPELRIPAGVDAAVRHALEPDRDRRTPSTLQLYRELEAAV